MRLLFQALLFSKLLSEFRQRTGHTILERYGMTEAGITSNPYNGNRFARTVIPLDSILWW